MAKGNLPIIFRENCRALCAVSVALIFFLTSIPLPAFAFSIKKERETGEKLLLEVRKAFSLLDDPDLVQYLNSLGGQVLDVAGPQYFHYRYYLINSPQINAFAAPSGMIFFFTGLVLKMESEDELLAVLAHETGHVVKRHISSGVKTGAYTGAAAVGLAILGATLGGAAAPALMTGALAAGQSVNLYYSREHEQEADLCAYQWMKTMGRNSKGELNMLKMMRRIARYRSEKLPQYLLTHPNPEERMGVIESLLAKEKETSFNVVDDFAFLRFKYRILAEVKNVAQVRAYMQSILAGKQSNVKQRAMAEFGLSQLARREKDYAAALAYLHKVRSVFPDKNDLLVDQGVIEADSGDTSQALDTLRQAVAKDGDNMYGCFALGKLLKQLGKYDEAVEYFSRVQSYLPEYPQLFFEWGQLENMRGNAALSLFFLGKFNLYQGRLTLAKEEFEQVLQEGKLPEKERREGERLLALIARVKKKS